MSWVGRVDRANILARNFTRREVSQSQDLQQTCNYYYFLLEKVFSFYASFDMHGCVQEHMNLTNHGLSVYFSSISRNTNSASNAVIIAVWYEELKINQFGVQTKCDSIIIVKHRELQEFL